MKVLIDSCLGIFLILIAGLVEARMYQWVNPGTGSSQLSGKPPAWYRTEAGGPRVLVFENSQLLDDTSVNVEPQQRLKLRQEAFQLSAEEQKKGLTSKEAIARLEEQIRALVESPELDQYLQSPDAETDLEELPELITEGAPEKKPETESADERVERLKALISRWDDRRTSEARSLLDAEKQSESAESDNSSKSDDDSKTSKSKEAYAP